MKKRTGFYKQTEQKTQRGERNSNFSESKLLLKGIYKQLQGFGFVDTVDEQSGEKKGYFVHETKKSDAFEGDEVLFEVQMFRGREEAIIKKVTQRSEYLIVGILQLRKTFAFVIPKNQKLEKDIFIPGKFIEGYREGAMVAVKILKWEGKNPEGRIVEILDDIPEGRRDIYAIAFEMGARKSFGDKVKHEVATLQRPVPQSETGLSDTRTDLRHLLTYTIDGAESKDLDDAISILPLDKGEMSGGQRGWKLFVHIADVAEYVRENTELDREARKRATSIYLADQVIPMLPAELSNGLCSLHPGEPKLTLTCEMELNMKGHMTTSRVYESIIESDYRLTYREIDEITQQIPSSQPSPLEEKERAASEKKNIAPLSSKGERIQEGGKIGDPLQFGKTLSPELQKNILLLKELADILEKNATNRGSLGFDFPETKIILDEAGKPLEYTEYEHYDSYKIIEVCMVLANESIAKLFSKIPFLYRVHEEPDEEDIEKFLKLLEGIDTSETKTEFTAQSISPRDIQSLLRYLQSHEQLEGLQKLVLRTMKKAAYSEKNIGHFGLALTHYSHFTSPIRRYSDLQIHRIIKEKLHKKYTAERKAHYQEILPKVARVCSDKSDKAEKMEYKVRDMLACKYMHDKIGQQFCAKISGISEKGFFVELPNTIEGFVDISSLPYIGLKESFCLMHQKTGEELRFGDQVEVELKAVDLERYRLEFELL